MKVKINTVKLKVIAVKLLSKFKQNPPFETTVGLLRAQHKLIGKKI